MISIDKTWAFCVHFSNRTLEFLTKSFTFLGNCCIVLEKGGREALCWKREVERKGETDRGKERKKASPF